LNKPNFRIGMTAPEVVVEIATANVGVKHLLFCKYTPKRNTSERKSNSLSRALSHDMAKADYNLLPARDEPSTKNEINLDTIGWLMSQKERSEAWGVLSEVGPQGYPFQTHIPMMDFQCPQSSENLRRVKKFLRKIGQNKGVILDSGRSYHYYGSELMHDKDFLNFLGDCLLSDLVDRRYVGHRLKDKLGILRISGCSLRPKVPTVVAIL
jgi:hypothetical protein